MRLNTTHTSRAERCADECISILSASTNPIDNGLFDPLHALIRRWINDCPELSESQMRQWAASVFVAKQSDVPGLLAHITLGPLALIPYGPHAAAYDVRKFILSAYGDSAGPVELSRLIKSCREPILSDSAVKQLTADEASLVGRLVALMSRVLHAHEDVLPSLDRSVPMLTDNTLVSACATVVATDSDPIMCELPDELLEAMFADTIVVQYAKSQT